MAISRDEAISQLAACPFCGGRPEITRLSCQGQGCGNCVAYQTSCSGCELGLPPQSTLEEAMAAWRTGVTQALQLAVALKVDLTAAGRRMANAAGGA